jgi:uncharacterized protein YyaL (SSP411 family)
VSEIACRYWDVSEAGNFEHRNILHVTLDPGTLARLFRREPSDVQRILGEARVKLFEARERRVKPGRDEKILTSWNGLTIGAFARAAEVLEDEGYAAVARRAVAFLAEKLQRDDRILGTIKDGVAKLNGYLDDYAFVAAGLLDLFEAVQDTKYLAQARQLADAMIRHFWDPVAGGFFFTSDDHEELIVRTKPAFDGSIPSGNSVATMTLLRLYHHTGTASYLERAEAALRLFGDSARRQPFGFANLLCAADLFARGPFELVLVGNPEAAQTRELWRHIRRTYLPNRTLSVVDPAAPERLPPPVQGKGQLNGRPTVYVCRGSTCSPPATGWEEIRPLLRA